LTCSNDCTCLLAGCRYPPLQRRFGALPLSRAGLLLSAAVCLALPLPSLAAAARGATSALPAGLLTAVLAAKAVVQARRMHFAFFFFLIGSGPGERVFLAVQALYVKVCGHVATRAHMSLCICMHRLRPAAAQFPTILQARWRATISFYDPAVT
jgi:hypothetical protein